MRVLPSGKALASQANIRGFESHHPLQTKEVRWKSNEPLLYSRLAAAPQPEQTCAYRRQTKYELICQSYSLLDFFLTFRGYGFISTTKIKF